MADVKIINGKAIEDALSKLEAKTSNKILRDSFKESVKPILTNTISLAPKKTGRTAAALKIFTYTKKSGAGAKVGTSAKAYTGDEFYAYFQEHGFHLGKRPSRRRSKLVGGYMKWAGRKDVPPVDTRKWIEGKHFMEKSFDGGVIRAIDVALNLIADKIHEINPTTMKIQVTIQ